MSGTAQPSRSSSLDKRGMVGVGTEGVSDSSTYDLEGVPMPWYWTDDLARILIDTGKVDPERARRWISAPVAIRSAEVDSETVASSLLSDEDGEGPSLPLAA